MSKLRKTLIFVFDSYPISQGSVSFSPTDQRLSALPLDHDSQGINQSNDAGNNTPRNFATPVVRSELEAQPTIDGTAY